MTDILTRPPSLPVGYEWTCPRCRSGLRSLNDDVLDVRYRYNAIVEDQHCEGYEYLVSCPVCGTDHWLMPVIIRSEPIMVVPQQ